MITSSLTCRWHDIFELSRHVPSQRNTASTILPKCAAKLTRIVLFSAQENNRKKSFINHRYGKETDNPTVS